MARQIDSAVLIVSVLATFFATLFAALLIFRAAAPEPADPVVARDPENVDATPVGAGPPDPPTESMVRSRLEQLGVKCAEGVDC
jgi:hypothetical protein